MMAMFRAVGKNGSAEFDNGRVYTDGATEDRMMKAMVASGGEWMATATGPLVELDPTTPEGAYALMVLAIDDPVFEGDVPEFDTSVPDEAVA